MAKAIPLIFYSLLIIGEIICLRKSFISLYYDIRLKNRKKKQIETATKVEANTLADQGVIGDLNKMLRVVAGAKDDNAAFQFIGLSIITGLFFLIVVTAIMNFRIGLFGLIAGFILPFLILRTKLNNFRVDISREGETLITELLNNYRIMHYNMREAIQQTASTIQDAPNTKKMLLSLARNLTTAASTQDELEAIETFRYSINTSWGDMLASNMIFAEVDGIKVTEALKDLVDNIMKARKAMEQNKRENNEAAILLKWLFPVVYLGCLMTSVLAFGFSLKQYYFNQFKTETGIKWFIILIVTYVISTLITSILTRQKMDL